MGDRIENMTEGSVSRTYGYDSYGNRWAASSAGLSVSPLTPIAQSWFDSATNRLVGVAYDGSGNQARVSPFTLTYDGENRQIKAVQDVTGSVHNYAYDGDGRRVKRVVNGAATVYVYDAFGKLAAEYGTGTAIGTQYLTADHLGSTRLVTDAAGAVVRRHDYLPFGEEMFAGTGGRTTALAYLDPNTPDPVAQKFTGKERDQETGMDFFGARYLSGAQGRWTSPDEPLADQSPDDPQSWNLYGYVRNNPLIHVDSDGREMECTQDKSGNVRCTVTKPKGSPRPPPPPPPDTSWLTEMFLRYLFATARVAQDAQQVVQPAADWIRQPRNPTCMAGYTGAGGSIGFWAGGGVGTLGLAGGPTAAATIPGGAVGGAALGGGIGGVGGMIMCSSGTWGGSGGGRGGDYREKTRGANANDREQISAAARRLRVDGRAFGRYVEKMKKLEGRAASENFSFDELLDLAREFKAGGR